MTLKYPAYINKIRTEFISVQLSILWTSYQNKTQTYNVHLLQHVTEKKENQYNGQNITIWTQQYNNI